jgi:CO/xanthine dehydrogenase Mo-binding subunit
VKARIVGDSGAYASVGAKVLERAAGHACGPYKVPARRRRGPLAAYTNNPPCGAMRGFGVNQAHFALEACLDDAGRRPGWTAGRCAGATRSTWATPSAPGRCWRSVGIRKTLQAVKPHYDAAHARGRAVGIACGVKNSGIGNGVPEYGKARLVVEPDGGHSLYNGFTEMGQGLRRCWCSWRWK